MAVSSLRIRSRARPPVHSRSPPGSIFPFFISAQRLFAQLRGVARHQSYEKKLLRFTTPDVLVIDDLGLRPLERDEPLDLYESIRARYKVGSLIVTSNRPSRSGMPSSPTTFPNEASLLRLVSAVLAEISEEWETGRGYLTLDNG